MMLRYLSLAGLVLLIDQVSKYLVIDNLQLYETVNIIPGFNLFLTYNSGIIFGIMSESTNNMKTIIFSAIAILLSIVIACWLKVLKKHQRLEGYALSLILGGAIGNLVDRIVLGQVVDFIDFYIKNWHWYTFNFADSAILLGVFLLSIDCYKSSCTKDRIRNNFNI